MQKTLNKLQLGCALFFTSLISQAGSLNVGLSLVDLSNPYFSILAEEIAQQLDDNGFEQLNIYVHSSAYDLHKQSQQINDFIEKGVDILFISASESDAIAPSISLARKQGIIVVAVDIESRGADISVTSDNFQAGNLSCRYLAKRLAGKGDVAIINGSPISSVIDRVAGCRQAFAEFPEIRLVSASQNASGSFSGGVESMTYLLLAFPGLDAVFTINDLTALGAEEAAKQADNSRIMIASVDGSPAFLKHLQANDTRLVASAAQFPRTIARRAVSLALQKWQENSAGPSIEFIPTKLITLENVEQFANWQQVK